MRTVSFSNARVQKELNNQFVCCYTNTKGDPSAGASFSHAADDEPGPCGRGAGRQNVQTMFMTPDGEIYHVATGFLSPDDLLDELKFASELFALMKRNPQQSEKIVVEKHRQHLQKLGFSKQQITASDNELAKMFLSGPNPQDFGMKMPTPQDFGLNFGGTGMDMFGDISRQRVLHDHRYVIANPLIRAQQFEQDPGELVGNHKSFFGSTSAMDMSKMGGGPFNVQVNQNLGGPQDDVNNIFGNPAGGNPGGLPFNVQVNQNLGGRQGAVNKMK